MAGYDAHGLIEAPIWLRAWRGQRLSNSVRDPKSTGIDPLPCHCVGRLFRLSNGRTVEPPRAF
jgi:hypothetical protein